MGVSNIYACICLYVCAQARQNSIEFLTWYGFCRSLLSYHHPSYKEAFSPAFFLLFLPLLLILYLIIYSFTHLPIRVSRHGIVNSTLRASVDPYLLTFGRARDSTLIYLNFDSPR